MLIPHGGSLVSLCEPLARSACSAILHGKKTDFPKDNFHDTFLSRKLLNTLRYGTDNMFLRYYKVM